VYVELGSGNGGMLRDLSEEGFALRAMMPMHAGEKTPFCIVLNATVRIEGQGEILWIEENGRVAGVRFLEVSPLAQTQIHAWLNETLENLEAASEPEKTVAADAQSFDQLRRELRAPSGGPETPEPEQATQAAPLPEAVPDEPQVLPEPPLQPERHAEAQDSGAADDAEVPEPLARPVTGAPTFPGLPDFSSTQEAIEITFEALPPAPEFVPDRFPRGRPAPPAVSAPSADEEVAAENAEELPDISQILMQPPGIEKEFAAGSAALEPLHLLPPGAVRQDRRSTDWFTLQRAVAIMILLALVVAFSAYHRPLGEGLIWLGEQMGGGRGNPSAVPRSNDESPTGAANLPPSESAEPSTSTTVSPATGPTQGSVNVPAQRDSAENPLTEVTKSSQAPVTPLSGHPSTSLSGSSQESGLTEYSKALQLLHGRNSATNASEAVRLLWISVEKGNASAELTLAELYWHGEGVAHNCDQTRILLSAAARKGNGDAQKQLQQFQQQGCQ
jgi:PilZ domain